MVCNASNFLLCAWRVAALSSETAGVTSRDSRHSIARAKGRRTLRTRFRFFSKSCAVSSSSNISRTFCFHRVVSSALMHWMPGGTYIVLFQPICPVSCDLLECLNSVQHRLDGPVHCSKTSIRHGHYALRNPKLFSCRIEQISRERRRAHQRK